ncbi:hypothetical protein, partial [Salinisphaera sp. G21_0]|uniref:hypothetical protein n=1 Tax=Salinisphaera sp. G21_0 TaxID=2821094 RepID=UPI001ADA0038
TLGITSGSLLAAGGLGIAAYSTYQWITGYQEGLRGQELAMKPLTRGKELASAAVNSVSQGIQGIRERMNRQSVSTQEPAHEMSQVKTDKVTELDKRINQLSQPEHPENLLHGFNAIGGKPAS